MNRAVLAGCLAALWAAAAWPAAAGAAPTNAAPLRWSEITVALDRAEAAADTSWERAGAFAGRTAELDLEFVQEETDASGRKQFLFRHVAGRRVFLCYIEGTEAGREAGWRGVFRGRLASLQLQRKERRRDLYLVRLVPEPASTNAATVRR
jgi:hypothetical protein